MNTPLNAALLDKRLVIFLVTLTKAVNANISMVSFSNVMKILKAAT
jgi:hypothetical protein